RSLVGASGGGDPGVADCGHSSPFLVVGDDVHGCLLGGRGTAVDAHVGGPVVGAGVQLVYVSQHEPPGPQVTDLVVDRLSVGIGDIADAVAREFLAWLGLLVGQAAAEAFVVGRLVGRGAPGVQPPRALRWRVPLVQVPTGFLVI